MWHAGHAAHRLRVRLHSEQAQHEEGLRLPPAQRWRQLRGACLPTLWSILNYNCNYAHRRSELEELQAGFHWQIVFAAAVAKLQMGCGRYFLIEHPVHSRGSLEDPLVRLEADPRVYTVIGHGCARSLRLFVESDRFLFKPHKWMTNNSGVVRLLETNSPASPSTISTRTSSVPTRRVTAPRHGSWLRASWTRYSMRTFPPRMFRFLVP